VRRRGLYLCLMAALVPVAAACGKTERSGSVGETLSAKGLKVTLYEVDTTVPRPERDITGLSQPAPGFELVGARVGVCSNHGGATGPYDFGLRGDHGDGRLKFPERNYPDAFESLRDGCGKGWVVFELPRGSRPERVTYGFDDTGSYRREHTRVSARFSWKVETS
jgi:hypothetical protein